MSPDEKTLSEVLSHWDVGLQRLHPGINIAGSPERTEFRLVVEDLSGRLLIVERIGANQAPHKERIAETLAVLRKEGVAAVQP